MRARPMADKGGQRILAGITQKEHSGEQSAAKRQTRYLKRGAINAYRKGVRESLTKQIF